MRPPQNAGEDTPCRRAACALRSCFNEAPAERGGRLETPSVEGASLGSFNEAPAERGGRPVCDQATMDGMTMCFNEAPAERGGRLDGHGLWVGLPALASMRPPQNAGEDAG